MNAPGNRNLNAAFVQYMAEKRGVKRITQEATNHIAESVSVVCNNILKSAMRFQRMGRRKQMVADDIDSAIRLLGVTPPFGFDSSQTQTFRYFGSLIRDLSAREEREVELQTFIAAQLPKLPLAPILRSHWLVIDGKQPATPDNPAPESPAFNTEGSEDIPSTSAAASEPPIFRRLAKAVRKTAQVQIKTTTTHSICLEQQLFFKEVMEAIMGNDEQKRKEALCTLQTDCGLQSLLPRFSIVIAEGVRCNVVQRNMALLIYHMRVIQALCSNKSISLDRILHEILPAILSCILSKTLSGPTDNHWILREFSSKQLSNVCKSYGGPTVIVRVIKVLSDVFSTPNSSLTTIYAASVALTEFGDEVVEKVLAPNADALFEEAVKVLNDKAPKDEIPSAERIIEFLKKRGFISEIGSDLLADRTIMGLKSQIRNAESVQRRAYERLDD